MDSFLQSKGQRKQDFNIECLASRTRLILETGKNLPADLFCRRIYFAGAVILPAQLFRRRTGESAIIINLIQGVLNLTTNCKSTTKLLPKERRLESG
jgi:hypothetical protein